MSRTPPIDPAMAAAMLGLQPQGGEAAGAALALVMYTRGPWLEPSGAALDRARAAAARFRLSADLAVFVPAEPGRFSRRTRKESFRGVILALKHVDALEGDERTEALAQMRALLGLPG